MEEQIIQAPVTPVLQEVDQNQINPVEQEVTPSTPKQDDLLTRVSKFVKNDAPKSEPSDNINNQVFNDADLRSDIDAIEDPKIKEHMLSLRKSLMRGANDKFQEIAEIRKELQAIKGNNQQVEWTPERVQALINDPNFVSAAQQVSGESNNNSEDPLEYADDGVKSVVKGLQDQVNQLQNQNKQAYENQNKVIREQQHHKLSTTYANYDPKEIDTITFDMIEGKIQATPEHIYKAFKHDDNVRNAYEMGRRDERDGITEKVSLSSPQGISTSSKEPDIIPQERESSQSFINRVIAKNIRLASNKV